MEFVGFVEILCEAEWYSVDPYMRGNMFQGHHDGTMPGSQVARQVFLYDIDNL